MLTSIAIRTDKIKPSLQEPCAFCVLGMPRGGTTVVAKLIQKMDIFMGDNLPITAEDPNFSLLLQQQTPDHNAFNRLVAQRFNDHRRWGFKAPYRNHWSLLGSIPHCRYIFVFRDVLAVANRTHLSSGADVLTSLKANAGLQSQLLAFFDTLKAPAMLLSYETLIFQPIQTVSALADFCGQQASSELSITEYCSIISPNDRNYIANTIDHKVGTSYDYDYHFDIIDNRRVAGWIRTHSGEKVSIQVLINDRVICSGIAATFRKDLAHHFRDNGEYSFNLTFDLESSEHNETTITVIDSNSGRILRSVMIKAAG